MKRYLTLGLIFGFLFSAVLAGCKGSQFPPRPPQTPQGGEAGRIPQAEASREAALSSGKRVILGFYTDTGKNKRSPASTSLLNHADALNEAAFFWYTFDKEGKIERQSKVDLTVKEMAQKKGEKVFALVHNLGGQGFKPQLAHQVLANPAVRNNFINNLAALSDKENWDGIALDIEKTLPADRNNYSAFVSQLHSVLQAKNKLLNVAIPAKYHDYPDDLWSGAYDYAAIGKAADQVIIMTYEEHGLGTTQGPIASQGWVSRVIAFAAGKIPKEKIIMGLPVYGSDWASNRPLRPKSMSAAQAIDLAKKQGVNILYDETQQAPHFTFTAGGIRHEVYFEDTRSLSYKLDIAKKNQLCGVAIWRLGLDDSSIWTDVLKGYSGR